MSRREMAHRISRVRIAGDGEGLAAAAAEVLIALGARAARLLHPVEAAECHEGGRVVPDIGERMLAHVPEIEPRNALGRVAWQHLTGRRNVERTPSPAADASLRKARVVVRHD